MMGEYHEHVSCHFMSSRISREQKECLQYLQKPPANLSDTVEFSLCEDPICGQGRLVLFYGQGMLGTESLCDSHIVVSIMPHHPPNGMVWRQLSSPLGKEWRGEETICECLHCIRHSIAGNKERAGSQRIWAYIPVPGVGYCLTLLNTNFLICETQLIISYQITRQS